VLDGSVGRDLAVEETLDGWKRAEGYLPRPESPYVTTDMLEACIQRLGCDLSAVSILA
jgi:hypothetical protein